MAAHQKAYLEKALKTRTHDFRCEQKELSYFQPDSDEEENEEVDLNKVTDESTIHEGIFKNICFVIQLNTICTKEEEAKPKSQSIFSGQYSKYVSE